MTDRKTAGSDILRRTGRTTMMLEQAVRYAKNGERVLVVCANEAERKRLEGELQRVGAPAGVTVLAAARVPEKIRGRQPHDSFFIDHHAWEAHPRETMDAIDLLRARGVRRG